MRTAKLIGFFMRAVNLIGFFMHVAKLIRLSGRQNIGYGKENVIADTHFLTKILAPSNKSPTANT